jgi:hypothetical protein
MTEEEIDLFMAEVKAIDECYSKDSKQADGAEEEEDEQAILHKAALSRGQP